MFYYWKIKKNKLNQNCRTNRKNTTTLAPELVAKSAGNSGHAEKLLVEEYAGDWFPQTVKIVGINRFDNDLSHGYVLEFNSGLDVESFVSIVKAYEGKYHVKLKECKCFSFDDDGRPLFHVFYHSEEIKDAENFPNPYVVFVANLVGKEDWSFTLNTSTNDRFLVYTEEAVPRSATPSSSTGNPEPI